jgi:hypothetical protein
MRGDVRIASRQRRALEARANDAARADGVGGMLIDERTVWVGRPFGFLVSNDTPYTRWYRVSVTDLAPEQYVLYTQDQQISAEDLIEMPARTPGAAASEMEFTLVLGGIGQQGPHNPQRFEVIILEYNVADSNGPNRVLERIALQWIPTPRHDEIGVETRPRRLVCDPGSTRLVSRWRSSMAVTCPIEGRLSVQHSVDGAERGDKDPGLPPGRRCPWIVPFPRWRRRRCAAHFRWGAN